MKRVRLCEGGGGDRVAVVNLIVRGERGWGLGSGGGLELQLINFRASFSTPVTRT